MDHTITRVTRYAHRAGALSVSDVVGGPAALAGDAPGAAVGHEGE